MTTKVRKPKGAITLRAEQRKELTTTVVKCTLLRICKNQGMYDLIQEMVPVYTHLCILASNFLLYFITRELQQGHPLPNIEDQEIIGHIIRLAANLGDDAESIYPYLNDARREFKRTLGNDYPFIDRRNKSWLNCIIDDLKRQFLTCIKNSNDTRFDNMVKKWLYWVIDDLSYTGYVAIWTSFVNNTNVCTEALTPAGKDILEIIRSKMPRFSYKLKDRLPLMYSILGDYELYNFYHEGDRNVKQRRLFPLLPTYTWDAKYTPVTTTTLRSMAYTIEKGELSKKSLNLMKKWEIWRKYFNTIEVIGGKKSFDHRILTDGKGVSMQCTLPKRSNAKDDEKILISDDKVFVTKSEENSNTKKSKKKKLLIPQDPEVVLPSIDSILYDDDATITAIDPGRINMLTGVIFTGDQGKMKTFKFTGKEYYKQCGMKRHCKVIKKLTSKNEDVKSFNKVTLTKKTTDVVTLTKYLENLFQFVHELMKFKNMKEIKNSKFFVYTKKQKVRCRIRKLIPENSIIALGNAHINPTFGHLPSTPTNSLNKFIFKDRTVYDVCEFRTSKLCSGCGRYLEDPIINGHKVKSHSIRRCSNNECPYMLWDRDVNASINILNKLLNVMTNQESHKRFSRLWPKKSVEDAIYKKEYDAKHKNVIPASENSAKDYSL